MGKLNLERISTLAGEIRKAIKKIEALLTLSQNQVMGNDDYSGSLKYHLIVAIQAAINICYHITAQKGTSFPQNYGDCFISLVEMGILDKDLGARLAAMVKFRNVLIHLYWKVDDVKVYKMAQENIGDFELFINALAGLEGIAN